MRGGTFESRAPSTETMAERVGERPEKRVDLSRRQQDQRRRPREPMHQADCECTQGQAARVHMVIARSGVIGFAGMAVSMEVRRAVDVAVHVEVNARHDQAPQQVGPQQHQHDADGELEEVRDALGHDAVEREHHGARSEERQRVPQPPGRTQAMRTRSGRRWTAHAPSTPTWSCFTAAVPAATSSPRARPRGTASTR